MDLYAPITQALGNTQATIVDLMKAFLNNEIARQSMELQKEQMSQQTRALDMQAERDRQNALRQADRDNLLRLEREDRLRKEEFDRAFREKEAERITTHQGNVLELNKMQAGMQGEHYRAEAAARQEQIGIEKEKFSLSKQKDAREQRQFDIEHGQRTLKDLGLSQGIEPEVWSAMGKNPDAQTTRSDFTAYYRENAKSIAVAKRNLLSQKMDSIVDAYKGETDQAKKKALNNQYYLFADQRDLLDQFLAPGLGEKTVLGILEKDSLDDKKKAADDALDIIETSKKRFSQKARPPLDEIVNAKKERAAASAEIKTLTDYFMKTDPNIVRQAAEISKKQGEEAGLRFLREKRYAAEPKRPNAFGLRPGSFLDRLSGQLSSPAVEGGEEIDTSSLTY